VNRYSEIQEIDNTRSRMLKCKSPRSKQLITVIHSKFYQDMHNVCMAAKYKVHAPLCQCTAIQNLMRNKLTFHDKATTPLQIEDSLIVVPKIRTISVIYSGLDTSYQDFRKDPLEMEAKLLREIQDSVTEDSLSHAEIRTNLPPVEIQGAECLLAINPNAFACISANNYESVCKIQAWSRDAQQVALEQGQTLMKDHADFMGVFVWEDLLEFYKACESKDEERSREASHKLAEQLSQQDIQLASEMLDIPCFKMGHHLQTILRASSSKLRDFGDYWLTMVSKTQAGRFELDLPGGKRHLGESTWDGLVRESQEETSLRLDSSWIMEDRQPLKTTSERVNIYYQLWPPSLPFE